MAVTPAPKKPAVKKLTAAQRTAQANAKAGGYKDVNLDGKVDVDPLTRSEMAAQYQSAIGLIYSVPEISDIFDKAVKQQWVGQDGVNKFNAAVQNSNWYRTNDQYARKAWAAENFGKIDGKTSADWNESLKTAELAVQKAATDLGSNITPAQMAGLARRYVYEGWGEPGRQQLMNTALAGDIGSLPDDRGKITLTGASGGLADDLKKVASANGINYSDNWYQSAAKSVASGLTNAADWERDVRNQAAGMWGVYGDKIKAGANAYDLASPYINVMAQEFDMDPSQITLNDGHIRNALMGVDDQGNPVSKSLWDFQKSLREDPRWMQTKGALDEVSSTANSILKTFGLAG